MNERIKELIKQATNPDYDSDDGPMNELNVEKFAELIVRECVDKVDKTGFVFNEQPQYNDKQNALVSEGFFWALESVKQQIREHFGVDSGL